MEIKIRVDRYPDDEDGVCILMSLDQFNMLRSLLDYLSRLGSIFYREQIDKMCKNLGSDIVYDYGI